MLRGFIPALENYGALVEEIAALRPLIGNRGDALRHARDLVYWTSALREHDVPVPRIALTGQAVPADSDWLVKPLHSGGGAGIRWFRRDASAEERQHGQRPVVYQEYVEGASLSAVYVATDGEAVLLGVTKQLLGRSWRDALLAGAVQDFDHRGRTDFHYAGSVGPYLLSDDLIRQANTIGRVLAAECDLVGLFGVDLVMAGGRLWTIEINPRYTASIEVLERASAARTIGRRRSRLLCVQAHVDACTRGILPQPIGQSDEAFAGKIIVYAESETVFGDAAARWAAHKNLGPGPPAVADIPASGARLFPGQPICTLLADDASEGVVLEKLRQSAEQLSQLLERR